MNEKYNNIKEFKHLYLMNDNDIEKAAECNADAYIDYKLYYYFLSKSWQIFLIINIGKVVEKKSTK